MADKEKGYTLKTVQSELAKLEKWKEKKRSRMQELMAELKAINAQIKELEAVYDRLYQEDVQRRIGIAWFEKQKLSKEEIERMLEISVGLPKRIGNHNGGDDSIKQQN